MGKLKGSPVSPLQLAMRELYRTHSSSTFTSQSYDTEPDDLWLSTNHNLDIYPKPIEYTTLAQLENAQKHLRSSMFAAYGIQRAVEKLHSRIENFCDRADLLEIIVSPMISQSESTKQVESQVDRATGPAQRVLMTFDSLQNLRRVLAAGPLEDVGRYLEAIAQFQESVRSLHEDCPTAIKYLREGVAYLRSNRMVDTFQMEELTEVLTTLTTLLAGREYLTLTRVTLDGAYEHLAAAFRRILRDYGKPLDLSHGLVSNGNLLPAPLVQLLRGITEELASSGRLESCLEIYKKERSCKLHDSLQSLQPTYLRYLTPEAINILDWTSLEEHLALWSQHMELLVNVVLPSERSLCHQVFSHVNSDVWEERFGSLAMEAGLASFLKFGDAFARSKKEPQKLFKLLDMFECLESLKPSFEKLFRGNSCKNIQKSMRDLKRRIVYSAFRVFSEFKLQVEVQREGNIVPKGGSVLKLVSYVVNYLKYLLSESYKPLISQVLSIEQSWREGPGVEDDYLLPAAILQVMESLNKNVAARSKSLQDVPGLSSFFQMNNHRYIYSRSRNSDLGAVLGETWLRNHRENAELHASQYRKETWGSVLLHLSSDGLSGSSFNDNTGVARELIKQRIRAFQAATEGVYEAQRGWHIADQELRQQVALDVIKSIVPSYRSFLHKFTHVVQPSEEAPDSIEQLIKYSPENVERMVASMFQGTRSEGHRAAKKSSTHIAANFCSSGCVSDESHSR